MQVAGAIPAWAVIAIVACLGSLMYLVARPLLRRNFRGMWMFQVVHDAGLIDVENRAIRAHRVPPQQVFEMSPSRRVLISGVLDQLFQQYRDDMIRFVQDGGHARVMLIHPRRVARSLRSSWPRRSDEWLSYWMINCNEAQIAVDAILDAGLDRMPGFELRFMSELPPFLGILVTDTEQIEGADRSSFVRVQPLTMSKFIGRGVVVTFQNVGESGSSPFGYFAQDLLRQWEVAIDDPPYLDRRRRAIVADHHRRPTRGGGHESTRQPSDRPQAGVSHQDGTGACPP